jgi:uncharacterized RDD family membrane protein YckC
MGLACPRCSKVIEFSGERPSFCPYCGISLSSTATHIVRNGEITSPYTPPTTEETTDASVPAAEPGSEGVPTAIGGYRLTRLIGAGGMGAVYEGVGEDSGQHVAVKLLTSLGKSTSSSMERFRQEGQLASQLTHPNCVFVLKADEEAGKPYIVMELMPGETLRDYVRRVGPLPINDAIAKIIDVIDGLIEAHRLNILHRDVKPSNCFLMKDGRVKIGDFGLSKSLSTDVNLTQSGSFLGTVLYAAPEQIRGEPLDFTADVYSVCATLYFLLTGQAPFQHENPTVVISRVISETPPDIRLRRPDLPRRLQRIIMRGLERQPEKRIASLEELRAALSEQFGRPLNRSSLGPRVAGHIIDIVLLMPVWIALTIVEKRLGADNWPVWLAPAWIYFTLSAYFWGASFGKWVMRLRVRDASAKITPSFLQVGWRTFVFLFFAGGLGSLVERWIVFETGHEDPGKVLLVHLAGCLFLFSTMRSRNGYRGVHEFLSRTRVVQLNWPRPVRRLVPRRDAAPTIEPMDSAPELPQQFGSYQPQGILERSGNCFRLLVVDANLRRQVNLIVRPAEMGNLPESRRTLSRPGRVRWLTGGTTNGWAWDALLAPNGCRLADLVEPTRPLDWPETLPILEQVADESIAAAADQSLARPLAPNSVFVRPDGRIQIVDSLQGPPLTEQDGLALLREIVPLALEGRARPAQARPKRIRAVMPLHASQTINRLMGVNDQGYADIRQFRADLTNLETRPSETATPQRLVSLGFHGLFLALPMLILLGFSGLFNGFIVSMLKIDEQRIATIRKTMERNPAEITAQVPLLNNPLRYRSVFNEFTDAGERISDHIQVIQRGLNAAERLGVRLVTDYVVPNIDSTHDMNDDSWKMIYMVASDSLAGPQRLTRYWENWELLESVLNQAFFIVTGCFAAAVIVWSILLRDGLALWFAGLVLVRADGRKAARWQSTLRAAVVWLPPLILLCLCVAVKTWWPERIMLHNSLWLGAVMLLMSYGVNGVLRPGRGWHDRIAGVYVVPR